MSEGLYDRIEAWGESLALDGEPTPYDDNYWDGVLETPSSPAKEE